MKKIIRILMLSCLKATELIEKRLLFRLSLADKIRLKLHLTACKACRNYDKQSRLISEAALKIKEQDTQAVDMKQFIKDLKVKIRER